MSYKQLYDYCQSLVPKVSRAQITPKVLELTGVDTVRTAYNGKLNPQICRGLFIDGTSHVYGSGKFIVLYRDLNYCWKRMVFVKELMHLFDREDERTRSSESFEKLLNDLALPDLEECSPQIQSESNAIWMALGVLCPEKFREQYKKEKEAGLVNDYGIAVKLRIPEQYIPLLLHPIYEQKMQPLLN